MASPTRLVRYSRKGKIHHKSKKCPRVDLNPGTREISPDRGNHEVSMREKSRARQGSASSAPMAPRIAGRLNAGADDCGESVHCLAPDSGIGPSYRRRLA
jgi:hypothetical protein